MRLLVGPVVIFVVVATLVSSGSAWSTARVGLAQPRVVTLVRGGTIEAFAQDGDRIAWVDTSQQDCYVVRLKGLATGRVVALGCAGNSNSDAFPDALALAGTRALWAWETSWLPLGSDNTVGSAHVVTSTPGHHPKELIGGGEDVESPGPIRAAGDGGTLVYVDNSGLEAHLVPGGLVPGSYGTYSVVADGDRFAIGRSHAAGCACNDLVSTSPDRRRFLYSSERNPAPGTDYYVSDGLGHERLVTHAASGWVPQWSTDSRRLLVVSDNGRGGDSLTLVTVDVVTGARRTVARDASGWPWSSDGRSIVYGRSTGSGGQGETVIVRQDGTRTVLAGSGASYSPNGRLLALIRKDGIYVAAAAGTGFRRVPGTASSGGYSWAPDSNALLVERSRGRVYSTLDGKRVYRLPGKGRDEAFSGDGKWFAYNPFRHLLLNLSSGALTPLPGAATFSPDSSRVAFSDNGRMAVRDLRTGKTDQVSVGELAYLTGLTWSPDASRLAWTSYTEATSTHAVWVWDERSGLTSRLGSGNEPGDGPNLLWSPDSTQLAAGPAAEQVAGAQLAAGATVYDTAGGTVAEIPGVFDMVEWLPDSHRLLVVLTRTGNDYAAGEFAIAADGTVSQITHTTPVPAWTGVEIRRTSDGRMLHSFPTTAAPSAIALTANRVALVFEDKVELRTLAGTLVQTLPLDPQSGGAISMSGDRIVFAVGHAIEKLNIGTGATTTIAQAKGAIVGLSIDGNRVAWAEQLPGPDVIRAVEFP